MTQPQSYGIKETGELQDFLATIINLADTTSADGKIDTFELISFVQVIPQVRPAIEGLKEIPKELGDLSEAERVALALRAAERLKLRNANTERLAEKGYALTLAFVEYYNEIRNSRQAIPA